MKAKLDWRKYIKHVYLIAAVASFVVGGFIAYLGNEADNPLFILVGFAGLAGGVLLLLARRKLGDIRFTGGAKGKEVGPLKPANCLNLYPDYVAFEYEEKPTGQSVKNHNDGQYYWVNQQKLDGGLEVFTLPDEDDSEIHYDPGEMASVVTMPSNKKYFTWSSSTMQKISVGIMAVVILGEIIGLIAAGG